MTDSNQTQQPPQQEQQMVAVSSRSAPSQPNLFLRLAADTTAAGIASLLVSPFITVIDRAIIENASGKKPLWTAVREYSRFFVTQPHKFIARKDFGLVFALYFATYGTANYIDTGYEYSAAVASASATDGANGEEKVETHKSHMWVKFLGSATVNVSGCIIKDRGFTRMFGIGPPKPLPAVTYALFAARDSMTNISSFTFPPLVAEKFRQNNWFSSEKNSKSADYAAQLISPMVMQLFSTPLHLLGVDFYNHRRSSLKTHVALLRKEYLPSLAARVGRIGPAFGFGGMGNKFVRDGLMGQIKQLEKSTVPAIGSDFLQNATATAAAAMSNGNSNKLSMNSRKESKDN